MYEAKLAELVLQAEKEDTDIRARAIQLDMILEQTNENNYGASTMLAGRRGGAGTGNGADESGITPPSSIPEMGGGIMYGGGIGVYPPKGKKQTKLTNNIKSFVNTEDEDVYTKNFQ
jgi:hypothetical protein